jgi:hypothetical protein
MAAPFRDDPGALTTVAPAIRVPTKSPSDPGPHEIAPAISWGGSVGWSSGVGAAAWAAQAGNPPPQRDTKPTFTRNRGLLRAVGEREPMGAMTNR